MNELDRLLNTAATAERTEPLPDGLLGRVETAIRVRRRRHRVATVGLGAAAAIVAAVSWFGVRGFNDHHGTPIQHSTANAEPPSPVTVEVKAPDGVIVERVPTTNPNVTIIWLHPEIKLTDGEPSSHRHRAKFDRSNS